MQIEGMNERDFELVKAIWAHFTDEERKAYRAEVNIIAGWETRIYWKRKALKNLRQRVVRRMKRRAD